MIKKKFLKFNYNEIIIGLLFLYIGMVYFSIAIANISLGVGMAVFIFGVYLKKIKLNFKKSNWYLYSIILVPLLLTLLSVLNSVDLGRGLKFVWLRAPILIIPFIVVFLEFKNKEIKKGISIFVLLSILASLKTVYNAIRYAGEDVVFVTDFTFFITPIQHPYFGILMLISAICILEFKLIKIKTIKIGTLLLLLLVIALSTSRMVYLLSFIVIGYYLFKKTSKIKALFLGVLLAVFAITFILSNQSIRAKFQSSYQYENSPRLKLWDNAYKIVKSTKNLAFGIGIGDYYQNKKEVYFFRDNDAGALGYNPHSQIVEFFVTNGLFGLVLLIIAAMLGVKYINKQNSFSFLVFVIIIIFSVTESIFTRQYGVQLYSVFIPLLFKENFKKQ